MKRRPTRPGKLVRLCFGLPLLLGSLANAQVPEGSEFRVNTYTTGVQARPAISHAPSNDFVVVWTSSGQDGQGDGVFGQRYDSLGQARGSEFFVHPTNTGSQIFPQISHAPDGGFAVVWMSFGQDGAGYGVFSQRYDSLGQRAGNEFRVNTVTAGDQFLPDISHSSTGEFVVVWHSFVAPITDYEVFGQRYDSGGSALGGQFRVNTYTTHAQYDARVSHDPSGGFRVVWSSYQQDGSRVGVVGQRFDSLGQAAGTEFLVNSATLENQRVANIGHASTGAFTIVWQSDGQDGFADGVFGQHFDSDGLRVGSEFQANTFTTESQSDARVSHEPSGAFLVAWHGFNQDGSVRGVFARRFTSLGQPAGTEFQVNTHTPGTQSFPSLSHDSTGNFVVVWQSNNQDGSSYGIFAQRFLGAGNVTPSTTPTHSPTTTETPTFSPTPSSTASPTAIETVTFTRTPTSPSTATPTQTLASTGTFTPTATATGQETPTDTATATRSATALSPSVTPTATPTGISLAAGPRNLLQPQPLIVLGILLFVGWMRLQRPGRHAPSRS